MKFYSGIMLIASASNARASKDTQTLANHDALNDHSHNAYHNVERSCAMDVELFCISNEEYPLISLHFGDSFFNWIFVSSSSSYTSTTPEVLGLNQFIDQMFDSVLVPYASREQSTFLFHQEIESHQNPFEARGVQFPAAIESNEVPQLAYQLQNYGASLLHDAETSSEQYLMARRLTETDTTKIDYQVELPFGCKNYCLRKAYEHQMVSEKCTRSIWMLEKTFVLETEISRHEKAFMSRLLIYMASFVVLMILLGRYISNRRSSRRRSLNQRVVTTVYNNFSIRKQVELEIGESIGHSARENDDSCSLLGDSYEKKSNGKNKDFLPAKTILYKGVPVQIV